MEKIIPRSSRHGFATVEIHRDDKVEILTFRGVRCGLHWPSASSPGFYTLVGESVKSGIVGGYSLRVLREGEDQIPSKLYEKLSDDLGSFGARDIFADMERFKDYVLDIIAFKKEQRPRQAIYLKPAPFYQDFSHGIFTIREWVKKDALVIPKESVIYNQLKGITSQDLKDSPEEKFFAVDALRHAVGSFKVQNFGPLEDSRWRPRSSPPPIGAFT